MKTFLKYTSVAVAMAMAPFAASAAGCDVGSCTLTQGSDGQNLSSTPIFNIGNIQNDADSNSFNFVANFVNDTNQEFADFAVSVLQFAPAPGFGTISNLVLSVFGNGITRSFQITDANGANVDDPNGRLVERRIRISGVAAGQTVSFELEGNAAPSQQGGVNPDLALNISPIPLPAGGLLLLSALGAGVVVRRRKTQAA